MTDRDIVRLARALGDPTRVRILRAIAASSRACCGALAEDVAVRPATMSHHLRVLGEAGLIELRRDGQFVRVRLAPGRLDAFGGALRGLVSAGEGTGPRVPGADPHPTASPRRARSRRVA